MMETLQYSGQINNIPQKDVIIKTPRSTPRHVRIIGGLPFEAFIVDSKRYIIPYLCDSCSNIRDNLVDISDELTHSKKPSLQIDPDVSEWSTSDPIYTTLFDPGIIDTRSRTEPINFHNKKPTKGYVGFRYSKSQKDQGKLQGKLKKPAVLKYSTRDSSPYQEEHEGTDNYNSIDSLKLNQLSLNGKSKSEPFSYVDSRLNTLPQYGLETNEQKEKQQLVWNNWEKLAPISSDDVMDKPVHYMYLKDPKFHIERYKLLKNNARDKKQNNKTSFPHFKIPATQLPEAFRAGWEFWETFDSAGKRKESTIGRGYTTHRYTLTPKIDITKESMINLTIMDIFKREQKLAKQKEKGDHIENKSRMKEMQVIKSLARKHKTNVDSKSAPPLSYYYCDESKSQDYPSLKGKTAPKHFMDTFNALRVKTSGGKVLSKQELEKILTYQDNCGITVKSITNEE